jgi:hypothetical protein
MYMVTVTVILLILSNQNIFAKRSKKTAKILDGACIYKPNTSFLFTAVYDSSGSVKTEYMLMRIIPEINAGEIILLYDYYKDIPKIVNGDSIANVEDKIYREETILYDNKKELQLHPPRSRHYYFLSQISPFPRMKLPVKEGGKSKWGVVGKNFTGKLLLLYKMQNSSAFKYQYKDSLIENYEKKGTAISPTREYTASYIFNKDLGFVKWRLSTSDNISSEFTLIDTYPFLLKDDVQTDPYTSFKKIYKQHSGTKK